MPLYTSEEVLRIAHLYGQIVLANANINDENLNPIFRRAAGKCTLEALEEYRMKISGDLTTALGLNFASLSELEKQAQEAANL